MAAAVTCLMIERIMCGLMIDLMWVGKDRVLVDGLWLKDV